MRIIKGNHTILEARAKVGAAADLLFHDYYSRTAQIRLTSDEPGGPAGTEAEMEVMLDEHDVVPLIECALRHPNLNMRQTVLTAVWNHPDTFRQLFRFGLTAPDAFPEIGKIVQEELDKSRANSEAPVSGPVKPTGGRLLPRLPLPAHLRDRARD